MIFFFSLLSIGGLGFIFFLYLHKHSSKVKSPVSSTATVHTTLRPNGSVFVGGELWLAQSLDGKVIPESTEVTVVGLQDHLLLVSRSQ